MAEPMRTMAEPADDSARYQPMSLLAIVAICVGGGFAVLVVILTGVGLFTRRPVLEPMLILFAVVGVVLAIAARWQIRNAEGTMAGTGLAKAAFWLSIVVGCCYLAYFYGNALAIQNQAKEFVDSSFFKPLQTRDYKQLNWACLPASGRRGMTKDEAAVRFADTMMALEHLEFVRVMDRAGKDAAISMEGVKEWKETSEGVEVDLNYVVKTREGEFKVRVNALGTDSNDSAGRQWSIRSTAPFISEKRLTTCGRVIIDMQFDALRFLREWLEGKLVFQRFDEVYFDTLPISRAERYRRHSIYVSQAIVGNVIAGASSPGVGLGAASDLAVRLGNMELSRRFYLPGFDGLPGYDGYAAKVIHFDERSQQQPSTIKEQLIPRVIHPSVLSTSQSAGLMEVATTIDVQPSAIRVSIPVDFKLPEPLNYLSGGKLVAVCTDKEIVAKLNELQRAPWDSGQSLQFDTSTSLLASMSHEWRIERLELDFTKRPSRVGGLPEAKLQFEPPKSASPK